MDAADAVQKGCKKVAILTVDTDVVMFAVASFSETVPHTNNGLYLRA